MKQKDYAVIFVVAIVSAVISFVVSNKLFVTSSNRQQQYEVVDAINPDFQDPNPKYFNPSSINPTPNTQLGTTNNQNPFNGSNQ